MRFHIVTLFPELFESVLQTTMLKKGQERGALQFHFYNIRDYATDKHRVTDDTPYGGGHGMVMKVDPLVAAIEATADRPDRPHRVLLTPQGRVLTQGRLQAFATLPDLVLVCGRYEGVDERVRSYVDEEISVGDYVLSGGEIPALTVIDAVARLVPGVLGCAMSAEDESFVSATLEYPQYTRPEAFRGVHVPPVLVSGDHAAIAAWRRREALRRTHERRPELLVTAELSAEDRAFLETLRRQEGGPDPAAGS